MPVKFRIQQGRFGVIKEVHRPEYKKTIVALDKDGQPFRVGHTTEDGIPVKTLVILRENESPTGRVSAPGPEFQRLPPRRQDLDRLKRRFS